MKKKSKDLFLEQLIQDVHEDFEKRQKERKPFEAQWKLNNNFYNGEQYISVNKLQDLEEIGKMYYWQHREVFNHISPIIDSRLSKLCLTRPEMEVLPASSDEDDKKVAKLSQNILRNVYEKLSLDKVINKATHWSEICGTSFYKISWNACGGKVVYDKEGKKVFEGEVEICALSPFEIYPDSPYRENVEECESIIQAKLYSTQEIKRIWGVDVKAQELSMSFFGSKFSEKVDNSALVIERYEAPTKDFPDGRLVCVCADSLLFDGPLPFVNLADGKRGFPFVRQTAVSSVGSFWGTSVIEKLIPIQRAYNAVKNRKHELINRLSMGVMIVEDGSVDVEDLEQNGLEPGKIIVYKQGANAPKFLSEISLPQAFSEEEESLIKEFSNISGVTDILTNEFSSKNLSGSAIELLLESDSTKIQTSIDEIKIAIKNVAKMILRLYKQFAVMPRLLRAGKNNENVVYWKNSDLALDDIEFLPDSTATSSLSSKREAALKLLSSGALKDENGRISDEVRSKILELFGISNL